MTPSPGNWSIVELGALATFQEGYVNPPQGVSTYFGNEVKWLRAVDLNDSMVHETSRRLSLAGYESAGKSALLFEPNTLAISKSGTIGRLGILKDFMCGNRAVINIRARHGQSDNRFLFYVLLHNRVAIQQLAVGSVQKNLYCNTLSALRVLVPPIRDQRKIASILSAYDDLIENNTRRIKILEEMAQMIYRDWFVNLHFPGHENVKMVESELGLIPEMWETKRLGQICTIVMGQSPSSEYYNEHGEGLPFHQGVTNFGQLFPSDKVFCTAQNRIAERTDILFSVRAPVGRINIATKRIVIGRGVSAIRSNQGVQYFVLFQLKEKFKEEDSIGGGTIFKAVTKQDMQDIRMLSAEQTISRNFESLARPIVRELEVLTGKNVNLRETRDLLLPKLISGELDVENVDIRTGEESA